MNRRTRDKRDPYFPDDSTRPTLGDGYTKEIYPEDFSPDKEPIKSKMAMAGEAAIKAVDLREKFIRDNEGSFDHMGG